MVKKLISCFLFLLVTAVAAQEIQVKGVIKDIMTQENLSHVTIATENNQHTTISNEEGAFALACPQATKKIVFSHLGYAPLEADVQNLPEDGVYYLEPKEMVLDEVMLTNIPMNQLIARLIQTSMTKLSAPLMLNTYYREFVKINDNYTNFADGLVDYHIYKTKKKIKTDITVQQSRAAKLPGADLEGMDTASGLDVRKAAMRDCSFGMLGAALFEDDNYKKHDFAIKSLSNDAGQNLEIITFTPKPDIKEALYNGKIIYDPATNLIYNVEVNMASSHAQYAKVHNFIIIKASIKDIEYNSAFKVVEGRYMLSHSSRNGVIRIWNKKRYDEILDFKSDLVVTGFSASIPEIKRKDKYKDRSLYERGNNYTEKFWLTNNSIVLTNEEQQIIKSLENKTN